MINVMADAGVTRHLVALAIDPPNRFALVSIEPFRCALAFTGVSSRDADIAIEPRPFTIRQRPLFRPLSSTQSADCIEAPCIHPRKVLVGGGLYQFASATNTQSLRQQFHLPTADDTMGRRLPLPECSFEGAIALLTIRP